MAGIESMFENILKLEPEDSESEWDEIEVGDEVDDEDELNELPFLPAATSSRTQHLVKRRRNVSKRAGILFPCSRFWRCMKARDSSKRVQQSES
jgi:hypothetical protein